MTRHLLASMLIAAAPLAAQTVARPNLVGTWELDPSKTQSDGMVAPPTAATYVITQHGDTMNVVESTTTPADGVMKTTMVWAADGYSWRNQAAYQGTPMTLNSVVSWDKGVMIVQTTTNFAGTDVERDDRWTVSADGKVLTIQDSINADGQVVSSSTTVFNRKD